GGDGKDYTYGGTGKDTLSGDKGDDYLAGEAGDDWLYCQAGEDTLVGGAGEDNYVFNKIYDGAETIIGYNYEEGDVIQIYGEQYDVTSIDQLAYDESNGAIYANEGDIDPICYVDTETTTGFDISYVELV
ncbi:MAG: hypothetical protein RLZZ171_1565, partial [Cyanobacteriota bacterium]